LFRKRAATSVAALFLFAETFLLNRQEMLRRLYREQLASMLRATAIHVSNPKKSGDLDALLF
jgi:hypothetical protein